MMLPLPLLMGEIMREQGVPEDQIRMQLVQMIMQQSQKPDPKMIEAQSKQQEVQAKIPLDQIKTQHEGVRMQHDILKTQIDAQQAKAEMSGDQMDRNHNIIMKRMDQQMEMIKMIQEEMKLFHPPKNGRQQSENY